MTPEIISFLAASSHRPDTVVLIACPDLQAVGQWRKDLEAEGARIKTHGDGLGCLGIWLRLEDPQALCAFHADNIIMVSRYNISPNLSQVLNYSHGKRSTVRISLTPALES